MASTTESDSGQAHDRVLAGKQLEKLNKILENLCYYSTEWGERDYQIKYLALNFSDKNHLYQILRYKSSFPEVRHLPVLALTFSIKSSTAK